MRRVLKPAYWVYEKRLSTQIRAGRTPCHLGLILDGNRRFAKALGLDVRQGHEFGVRKIHDLVDWCLELEIPAVTLFVFSTENFGRAPEEVEGLLNLFTNKSGELLTHHRTQAGKVRIKVIGKRTSYPEKVAQAVHNLESATADHAGLVLNIALAYGGREEIVDAMRALLLEAIREGHSIDDVVEGLSVDQIGRYLYMAGLPDPDFIIRTSGELRLSGFCLWQSAYSEYYFCEALWPEFRHIDFLRAIRSYQSRKRRFGH